MNLALRENYGAPGICIRSVTFQYIYVNDLFYTPENTDICDFADETNPHSSGFNQNEFMTNFKDDC